MSFFEASRLGLLLALLGTHCQPRANGAGPPARASASASTATELSVLTIPGRLLEQTSTPELSGIVYLPALDRYLLVSDDTGKKERGTAHAPWLFAMTTSGELEPEPLVIDGIAELNDAESISAGPDGTLFVCTSHSPNKKGETPAERAMLLQLSLRGRSLHVLGRLDLRGDGASPRSGILTSAGLEPSARLDIEAIAYHDEALYIGLKSPLSAQGSALVMRLAHPLAALKAGHVATGELSRYAEIALSGPGESGEVAEGISDLTFLPDGSLLVLGNSPKGMPRDSGGALFLVSHPTPGVLQARLLRRFQGLKPEGVSAAPGGKQLVVVFDRDREPPAWLRLPTPG